MDKTSNQNNIMMMKGFGYVFLESSQHLCQARKEN